MNSNKKVTALVSANGGAGKSTAAVSLGARLAGRGLKTVLVDLNMGMRALDLFTGLEDKVFWNICDAVNETAPLHEVLLPVPGTDHLFLLPASQTKQISDLDEQKYSAFWENIRKEADQVLIDTAPGIGEDLNRTLRFADRVILVAAPETAALRNADHIRQIIENAGVGEVFLLISRYPVKAGSRAVSPEEISELLPLPILGILPEDEEAVPVEGLRSFRQGSECERQVILAVRKLLGYEDRDAPVSIPACIRERDSVFEKAASGASSEEKAEDAGGKTSFLQRIRKNLKTKG